MKLFSLVLFIAVCFCSCEKETNLFDTEDGKLYSSNAGAATYFAVGPGNGGDSEVGTVDCNEPGMCNTGGGGGSLSYYSDFNQAAAAAYNNDETLVSLSLTSSGDINLRLIKGNSYTNQFCGSGISTFYINGSIDLPSNVCAALGGSNLTLYDGDHTLTNQSNAACFTGETIVIQ